MHYAYYIIGHGEVARLIKKEYPFCQSKMEPAQTTQRPVATAGRSPRAAHPLTQTPPISSSNHIIIIISVESVHFWIFDR